MALQKNLRSIRCNCVAWIDNGFCASWGKSHQRQSKALKHASLVRASDEAGACGLLKAGSAEVLASNKQRLLSAAETNPGYRLLEGRFTAIQHAVGVPMGRSAAAAYVRDFIEEVKASGFIQRVLEEAGLRGVVVAPPA